MTFPCSRLESRRYRDRTRRHARRIGVAGIIAEFEDGRINGGNELAGRLLMLPEDTDYSDVRKLGAADFERVRAALEQLSVCEGWFSIGTGFQSCFGGQVVRMRRRAHALLARLPPASG